MSVSPAHTKDELLARLRSRESALRGLGVARLALFGSFVRGAQSPRSDVDVLVVELHSGT